MSNAERNEYGQNVNHDLMLRKLSVTGTFEQRILRLRNRLGQEWIYKSIHKALLYSETGSESSFILMTECVPCILHLENRTGLKLITMMLHEGLTNAIEQLTYVHIRTANLRVETFISDIEEIFNTQIFGTTDRRMNWNLRYNQNNNRTRGTMMTCTDIITTCFATDENISEWISIVDKYNVMMKCLRVKEDFTDEQIVNFQRLVDC